MQYKLNGKPINIPLGYNELTFKQMIGLMKIIETSPDDDVSLICLLTDIPEKELKKYPASEYMIIKYYLSDWIQEVPDFKNIILPKSVTIGGQTQRIPNDIGNMNVECFEMCRIAIQKYSKETTSSSYLELCGLIAQNYFSILFNNDEYSPKIADQFEEKVNNLSWELVVSFGAFFLQKSKELMTGTKRELRNRGTHKTRLHQVMKPFRKLGAFFTR
jgi:hypothetical protein